MTAKWTLKKVEKETEPNCHHCGTSIKWVCWITSDAGGELAVGVNCCENFLSRASQRAARKRVELGVREEKLRRTIEEGLVRAYESHGDLALTQESMKNIANWMNVKGATWPWIKENYPKHYYSRFPNEQTGLEKDSTQRVQV